MNPTAGSTSAPRLRGQGAIAVVVLLALTAATVWTGAFGGEAAEELHEAIGWSLLAMIFLHILAVVDGENLGRAMVTGDKPLSGTPLLSTQSHRGSSGPVLSLAVIAGAAYEILQYDPDAFTLRSAEAYEHRLNADHDHARGAQNERDQYGSKAELR